MKKTTTSLPTITTEAERDDRRLRRLQDRQKDEDSDEDGEIR